LIEHESIRCDLIKWFPLFLSSSIDHPQCGVQGAGCRVQGAGCRVQVAGCRKRAGYLSVFLSSTVAGSWKPVRDTNRLHGRGATVLPSAFSNRILTLPTFYVYCCCWTTWTSPRKGLSKKWTSHIYSKTRVHSLDFVSEFIFLCLLVCNSCVERRRATEVQ
jgi:hypothetical protein